MTVYNSLALLNKYVVAAELNCSGNEMNITPPITLQFNSHTGQCGRPRMEIDPNLLGIALLIILNKRPSMPEGGVKLMKHHLSLKTSSSTTFVAYPNLTQMASQLEWCLPHILTPVYWIMEDNMIWDAGMDISVLMTTSLSILSVHVLDLPSLSDARTAIISWANNCDSESDQPQVMGVILAPRLLLLDA
ncbi:hypothetical protein EV702DRAFT_1047718 [Suillus placidus]|uniref:Uncharacterized protein n=1 Tax=Suillus placidus TaxID=48579 RepID=A0A9P7D076_9AGAM|nr:hypothetical protein EV702DRAFT_1047718 [Suillus placidus]